MLVVRNARAGRQGRAGEPSCGLPGRGNDAMHGPLRTATASGGACADRLWTLEVGRGDATSESLWATRAVVACW